MIHDNGDHREGRQRRRDTHGVGRGAPRAPGRARNTSTLRTIVHKRTTPLSPVVQRSPTPTRTIGKSTSQQIVKSSKGGPWPLDEARRRAFGKLEAGAGEEEHKDDQTMRMITMRMIMTRTATMITRTHGRRLHSRAGNTGPPGCVRSTGRTPRAATTTVTTTTPDSNHRRQGRFKHDGKHSALAQEHSKGHGRHEARRPEAPDPHAR